MRSLTSAALACVLVSACSEAPPSNCQQLSRAPLENSISFASYEAEGRSVEEWRRDLTAALWSGLQLPGPDSVPPPVVTGTSEQDGQERTDYTAESAIDGALVPFAVVEPAPTVEAKNHLVLLLHGHGETWDAPFEEESEMHDVGGVLLDDGYAVAPVEIRSFGEFLIDGLDHEAYLAIKRDGLYLGEVVVDTISVLTTIDQHLPFDKVSIMGHSLGGYVTLHVAALTVVELTNAISSGFFVPYDCIDTETHHDDPPDIVGKAELYDVAALALPNTSVDLLYGRLDLIYTVATNQMYDELLDIFRTLGGTAPGFFLTPENSHEVNPQHVLDALSEP